MQPFRHSLAAKGIRTGRRSQVLPYTVLFGSTAKEIAHADKFFAEKRRRSLKEELEAALDQRASIQDGPEMVEFLPKLDEEIARLQEKVGAKKPKLIVPIEEIFGPEQSTEIMALVPAKKNILAKEQKAFEVEKAKMQRWAAMREKERAAKREQYAKKRKFQYQVDESPEERSRRLARGYKYVVNINAKDFADRFKDSQGEDLAWNRLRLDAARVRDIVNAYPEVVFYPGGKVDVNDGRHRLAVAAEKGLKVPVAVKRLRMARKDFYKKKVADYYERDGLNIPITVRPTYRSHIYPIQIKDLKNILNTIPSVQLKGISEFSFRPPSKMSFTEQSKAWAQYADRANRVNIYSEPYKMTKKGLRYKRASERFDEYPELKDHMGRFIIPHEIGHHHALDNLGFKNDSQIKAEARADAIAFRRNPKSPVVMNFFMARRMR